MTTRKIGLLIGDENDWPLTFESLHKRLNPSLKVGGEQISFDVERVRIHPYALRADTSYNLVIDRLAWWYRVPREWLKKGALLNNVYLLNNPFTFQSMEKHSSYCAMMRLGLNIPETWMIPTKQPPSNPTYRKKYEITAERYHDWFDLKEIGDGIGYPQFMKPFDGGGWRGVTCVKSAEDLQRAYDESGEETMHLQKGIANFEIFARALAIGPQVMVMNYDPDQPSHGRYQIDHNFLSEEKGREMMIITKLINSFFRWEFNSCESILKDDLLSPIDFANACPDIAVTSLHFYYPWALKSLYKWSLFCVATNRRMRINLDIDRYFEIGDSDRGYWEKMEAYEKLSDEYFQTEQFEEFCDKHLKDVDDAMFDLITSQESREMLELTVRNMFPAHEHDQFIGHYQGLLDHWAKCQPLSDNS